MLRLILLSLVLLALPSLASAQDRYASIIVDADSLDILHARQIDAPRHPASLTKVMTLFLTFEAVERGEISLGTELAVSANAARTPPVKMGLKAGARVSVDTLVQAVAVRSSNDAAVVLAEALGGTEAEFAQAMTARAEALGMRGTVFRNATGLPDADQITTARDMAKLAHATRTRFPQHYHYFGQTEFRGRRSTNALLGRPDVDGFKTGYTRASGYNLLISAVRGERRLFAVVLGGASSSSRNDHMSQLIERGFEVMDKTTRTVTREPVPAARPVQVASTAATPTGPAIWAVQIGGFRSSAAAEIAAASLRRAAGSGSVVPRSGFADGAPVFSARVEGLAQSSAQQLCADHAAILQLPARPCRVLSAGRAGP